MTRRQLENQAPRLMAIARQAANTVPDADADGAVGHAMEQLARHHERLAEPYAGWVYAVAFHEALRSARQRRRSGGPVADHAGPLLVDVVVEQRDALRTMHTLKGDERRALSAFALGFSYVEIARLHGWTRTKVNRCIAEGRVAMRRAALA